MSPEKLLQGRQELKRARRDIADSIYRRGSAGDSDNPDSGASDRRTETESRSSAPPGTPASAKHPPHQHLGVAGDFDSVRLHAAGLPIGLQIIGPHWGEAKVLQLAHAYEQATAWHKRKPLSS